jgi:hypothetical protein
MVASSFCNKLETSRKIRQKEQRAKNKEKGGKRKEEGEIINNSFLFLLSSYSNYNKSFTIGMQRFHEYLVIVLKATLKN